MTMLAFPGQVTEVDASVPAGGCEMGQGRCVFPAELEVTLPATNDVRRLCREHVGYYMLAASGVSRFSQVLVRHVSHSASGRIGQRTQQ